jgi:hypothetical protein
MIFTSERFNHNIQWANCQIVSPPGGINILSGTYEFDRGVEWFPIRFSHKRNYLSVGDGEILDSENG